VSYRVDPGEPDKNFLKSADLPRVFGFASSIQQCSREISFTTPAHGRSLSFKPHREETNFVGRFFVKSGRSIQATEANTTLIRSRFAYANVLRARLQRNQLNRSSSN
jgi:hypothetical protein